MDLFHWLTGEVLFVILILKLILTPLLVGGITLLGRKFGPAVSGWLVGLPLTSAPVAFFLALEQGTAFAARAAQGTLMGVISEMAFCVAYYWLSLRFGWLMCWLGSWAMFFVVTFLLQPVSLSLLLTMMSTLCCLVLTLLILPRYKGTLLETTPPAWDLVGRVLITTAFVLALTESATVLGPRLSGLLSPLPLYATIFAIFTQKFQGAVAARQLLRGLVVGSFAFSVFFLLIALLIERTGIAVAFGCALVGVFVVQGCSLLFVRR